MAEVVLDFNPTESQFATELYNNQDKIKNRYYIKGENTERLFLDEVVQYVKKNYDDIPLVVAVANGPLNTILSRYYQKVSFFIPKGYKINAEILIRDLNRFLGEDILKTSKSTTKYNPFLAGITAYLTDVTNDSLTEAYGNLFEKNNEV
ncbi:MAG: hypothetical protein IKA36_03500 [Clostridia bacterium]|nr:hypothetical protein [Clostridia bacterium]